MPQILALLKLLGFINTIGSTMILFRARKEIETMDVKGILQSKTIWGILVSVLALILKKYGIGIDEAGTLTDLMALAGSIFAVYGRVTAKTTLQGAVK